MTGANLYSQAPVGYSSFQIGCIFVEYDLFNTTSLIRNLIYIRFGIILRFHPIPPFIFPLQSL